MIETILIGALSGAVAGVVVSWLFVSRQKKEEPEHIPQPIRSIPEYARPLTENEIYVKELARKIHRK